MQASPKIYQSIFLHIHSMEIWVKVLIVEPTQWKTLFQNKPRTSRYCIMLQIKEFHKTLWAVVPVQNAAYGNEELPNPDSVWWTPSLMDQQVRFYNSPGFLAFKAVKNSYLNWRKERCLLFWDFLLGAESEILCNPTYNEEKTPVAKTKAISWENQKVWNFLQTKTSVIRVWGKNVVFSIPTTTASLHLRALWNLKLASLTTLLFHSRPQHSCKYWISWLSILDLSIYWCDMGISTCQ